MKQRVSEIWYTESWLSNYLGGCDGHCVGNEGEEKKKALRGRDVSPLEVVVVVSALLCHARMSMWESDFHFLANMRFGEIVLFLRFLDGDNIREGHLRAGAAGRVPVEHNLHAQANGALTHEHVPHRRVDVLDFRRAGADHVPVHKLHRLGSCAADLSGDHHLAALRAGLHHEAENAVTCAAHRKSTDKLVLETLALRDCTQATVCDLLGIELDATLWVPKTLLHEALQLADAAALLAQHILRARRANDDFRVHCGHAHLDAAVSVFAQLAREHFVQLGVKDAVSDHLYIHISIVESSRAITRSHTENEREREYVYVPSIQRSSHTHTTRHRASVYVTHTQ